MTPISKQIILDVILYLFSELFYREMCSCVAIDRPEATPLHNRLVSTRLWLVLLDGISHNVENHYRLQPTSRWPTMKCSREPVVGMAHFSLI